MGWVLRGVVLMMVLGGAVGARQAEFNTHSLDPSRDPMPSHGGTGVNLILRWNAAAEKAATVDVAVYFHGYTAPGVLPTTEMLRQKAQESGMEVVRRTRPTLVVIPRGKRVGTRAYTFPDLLSSHGFERLVEFSLQSFDRTVRKSASNRGRLLVAAHSGGGAALVQILANGVDPIEIYAYDALYWDATKLITWAQRHIQHDREALASLQTAEEKREYMYSQGGALRVKYLTDGTGPQSQRVANALCAMKDPLAAWYRSTATYVFHNEIPSTFGPSLLADVTCCPHVEPYPSDDPCERWGGTCAWTRDCASRVTLSGLCPDNPSSDYKCCFHSKCALDGGNCMDYRKCSGYVQSSLCPGGTEMRCCFADAMRTSASDTTSKHSHLGGGAIAGIVVACIAALAVVVLGGLVIARRRYRRRNAQERYCELREIGYTVTP